MVERCIILIFWSCLRTILNTQNKGSLVFVSYLPPHLSLILSTLIKWGQNKNAQTKYFIIVTFGVRMKSVGLDWASQAVEITLNSYNHCQ